MKWVLVTGAGQRLGRAVALGLAQAHWGVVLHYRNSAPEAEAAAVVARAHSGGAVTVKADLDDPAERAALIAHATEKAGAPLSGLVNCAAMFEYDVLDTMTEDAMLRHMRTNAFTPTALAREFAEALPENARGAIVNFLDFKLATPYQDHFSYTLSKYALSGATDLLARALAPRVRVNAVAPGYVMQTPGQTKEDFERLRHQTPLRRGPEPEDVASAVRFLLENEAVTGQTIYVDSGRRFDSFDRDMVFM
jgi:NAD(P)-dependent dehydrogenase (short-subunit alcohol dehydrogenase family)